MKFILTICTLLFCFKIYAQEGGPAVTSSPSSAAAHTVSSEKKKPEEPKEAIRLRALPYITIINTENMTSYKWWEAKSKKVPEIYKEILKQMVNELKTESVFMGFTFVTVKNFSAEIVDQLIKNKTEYLITGSMLYDLEKPEEFVLKDLKVNSLANPSDIFIQESDKQLKSLEDVSKWAQKTTGFFRKEKYTPEPDQPQAFVQFKVELNYQEIEKIMTQIKTEIQGVEGFQIYSFMSNEVTFSVKPPQENLLKQISQLHFLKGPYKKEINDRTLIFTPLTEQDFENDNSTTNTPQ